MSGRPIRVVAAVAVVGAGVLVTGPAARAAVVPTLRADFGCSVSTLGRDVDAPASGRPFGGLHVSGTVTGLTPGAYHYLQVPGASRGDTSSGAAVVGTADARGTVTVTDEGLYLPSSFVMPGPVPFAIHRAGDGNGTVVARGQLPVAARGDANCTSLYRLRSVPATEPVLAYEFNLQPDGNVVERRAYYGTTLWTTGTVGHPGAKAVLQSDGNFVVRDTAGRALWNSGTAGHPGSTLTVQTDANVVIRDRTGRAIWANGVRR